MPLAGRDVISSQRTSLQTLFQSTRPARGATSAGNWIITDEGFQSTRPARGATPAEIAVGIIFEISIHAPREGRDR